MGKLIDLTGQKFGMLTVLGRAGTYHAPGGCGSTVTWRCRCDCGKETIVLSSNLKAGLTRSCGCRRSETARGNIAKAHRVLAEKREAV